MLLVTPNDELEPDGPLLGVNLRPTASASLMTTMRCLEGDLGKPDQARFKTFPSD